MRKFLVLILALVMMLVPMVQAQEEVEVPEVVVERIMEYGELIPELDHYNTVSLDDFIVMLAEEEITILDVREDAEVEETGVIEGSVHIPLRTLGENLDKLPDQEAKIVVVCKGGFRATIGMTALHILGYENAFVLVGGFDAWVAEDLDVVDAPVEVEAAEVPEAIDPELMEYVAEYLMNLPENWGAVKAADLNIELIENPPDYLYDVRSAEEWADPGYIEGASHVWINEFIPMMEEWPTEKDANIVIYCASGYRGGIASTVMGLLGYTNVRNLSGGTKAWVAAELPLVQP